MVNKNGLITLLLLTLCLFISCSPENENKVELWSNIDLSNINEKFSKLKISQLGAKVRYIPLETTDESLLGQNIIIELLDNEILVSTGEHCMLFDKTSGKYLRKIARRGEHPTGYSSSKCFIQPQNETLYFYRRQGHKFVGYNKEGAFINEIFLPNAVKTNFYPLLLDSSIVCYPTGFPGEEVQYRLFSCNQSGEITDSLLNTTYSDNKEDWSKGVEVKSITFYEGLTINKERPYGLLFKYGGVILNKNNNSTKIIVTHYPGLWNINNDIHFHEIFSDTIFHYHDGLLTPRWVFQTGDRHLSMRAKETGSKDGNENKLVITDVIETNDKILFHYSLDIFDKPRSFQGLYVKEFGEVFLSNGENGFIDDINNFLPIHPETNGKSGEFAALLAVEDIHSFFENNPDVKLDKSIMDLKALEYDANPVCVIIEPF